MKEYYRNENGVVYNDNCFNVFKKMKNESIDLVIIDPAYKVITGGKKTKTNKNFGVLANNDNFNFEIPKAEQWMPEMYRVLKQDTHCYVFTNMINLKDYLIELEKVGFKIHNLLIWDKERARPNRWYYKHHEYIIFCRKGKAKSINNPKTPTIIRYKYNGDSEYHPTAKHPDFIEVLIENSSKKNDVVLDFMAGIGSTAIASQKLERKFIVVEIEEKYCKEIKRRLEIKPKEKHQGIFTEEEIDERQITIEDIIK